MGDYNETTEAVLELLTRRPMTVNAVAKALRCSRSNVTTILLKLLRYGRVERDQEEHGEPIVIRATNPPVTRPRKVYVYSITPEGRQRLKRIGD